MNSREGVKLTQVFHFEQSCYVTDVQYEDWYDIFRHVCQGCEKKLFLFPNPFSDICYAYDGLVSTVLPDVPRASGFFCPP